MVWFIASMALYFHANQLDQLIARQKAYGVRVIMQRNAMEEKVTALTAQLDEMGATLDLYRDNYELSRNEVNELTRALDDAVAHVARVSGLLFDEVNAHADTVENAHN